MEQLGTWGKNFRHESLQIIGESVELNTVFWLKLDVSRSGVFVWHSGGFRNVRIVFGLWSEIQERECWIELLTEI